MEKILIIGSGGFGREVQWLIERINEKQPKWEIEGYIDDNVESGSIVNGYPVRGRIEDLRNYPDGTSIACAVGSAKVRKQIIQEVRGIGNYTFPNLVDPSVQTSDFLELGEGNIICAGNILTVNIRIKDFAIINLDCTVGHDAVLESFVTVYPGVHISGNCMIGECSELGTGSCVIQGKRIGGGSIVGAGAVVVRDLDNPGGGTNVYAGVPAKKIK